MVSSSGPSISTDDIRWRAGLTLQERLAALKPEAVPKPSARNGGQGRPGYWRAQHRAVIARSRDLAAIAIDPPAWLQNFRAAYARGASPESAARGSARGFTTVAEPLLAPARGRILQMMQTATPGHLPPSENARRGLLAAFEESLIERLNDALARTLVLELAVAGERNALVGETSEQRFAFFCECLTDPGFARVLLEQYPVLVRRLATMVSNWETATLTLLSRLAASRKDLVHAFFNGADPGPLMLVRSAGDSHRHGQAVHLMEFESGRKLVYKPRSVALESFYRDLAVWLNRVGGQHDLKEVRALDEGAYGWMEFVEVKPCRSRDELELYFIRLGAQLALTYLLGGTDLHFENVIANGEYPVLVDLETLFQTPLVPERAGDATNLGWRVLQGSVMGTLLLPSPAAWSAGHDLTDVSALGHSEGQLTPFRIPVWHGNGTDRMQLVHRRLPMAAGTSLPEYEGARATPGQYVEQIVQGFREAYELLQRQTPMLLSDSGPLAAARGKPVRHVFRATSWYGQLLLASHHPRFLEDAISAEAFLRNQLKANAGGNPALAAIEDAEVAELLAGDIPYFTSRVAGHGRIAGSRSTELTLPGDGFAECRARLEAMDAKDLRRQEWLVRIAMADLTASPNAHAGVRSGFPGDPSPDALVSTAARIGDRICDLAIMDGERATWLVPVIADRKRLVASVAGIDLYNGLSGIALFLGYLGSATGENRYRRVAVGAMAEALALYKASDSAIFPPGAYDGTSGFAYALVRLAYLLDRPGWIEAAAAVLRNGARQALGSPKVDIIAGQAGFLVAALATRCHRDDRVLDHALARLAGKLLRLAATARTRGKSKLPAVTDAGVAHGRAGIGVALARWSGFEQDDACGKAAEVLTKFDVDAIDTETRQQRARSRLLDHARLGWCRGLLGIALMSLAANKRADADTAWFEDLANDVITAGTEGPLCLCHGALGRLELMAAMAERGRLRDPQAAAAWRRQLLGRLLSGDWVADETHRLESPGLMLGLAGTGYALLRAARPRSIPSVLTLTE